MGDLQSSGMNLKSTGSRFLMSCAALVVLFACHRPQRAPWRILHKHPTASAVTLKLGTLPAALETVDAEAMAAVLLLPSNQQLSTLRAWVTGASPEARRRFAVNRLGNRAEPRDEPALLAAFLRSRGGVRVAALNALQHYGPELSKVTKDALWAAVPREAQPCLRELVWTLVLARDARIYERALELYQRGKLGPLWTPLGQDRFDPALVGGLVFTRTLQLVQSPDGKLRALVAATCSRLATTECLPVLLNLAHDPDATVAVATFPGLAKFDSEESSRVLAQTAERLPSDKLTQAVQGIANEAGLAGLLAALRSTRADWSQAANWTRFVFSMMYDGHLNPGARNEASADLLADRMNALGGDAKVTAARVLCELGDLRGLPVLAQQLRAKPDIVEKNGKITSWNSADRQERLNTSHAILALLQLQPQRLAEIRNALESSLLACARYDEPMQPNCVRVLAELRSEKMLGQARARVKMALRLYSKPTGPGWEYLSQLSDAMMTIGVSGDTRSRQLLESSLNLRIPGADQGLADLGEPVSFDALWNHASVPGASPYDRTPACRALAWAASPAQLEHVLSADLDERAAVPGREARLACVLEALGTRPVPTLKAKLMNLLETLASAGDQQLAFAAARALGKIGLSQADEARLLPLTLRGDASTLPVILALLAGARPEIATVASLRLSGRDATQRHELQKAFLELTDEPNDDATTLDCILRWVTNACAIQQIDSVWMYSLLKWRFTERLELRRHHSLKLSAFRRALAQRAASGDLIALETLSLMNQKAALLALRGMPGVGYRAELAAHRATPWMQTRDTELWFELQE